MRILFVYQFCTLGGVEAVLRNRLPEFYRQGVHPEILFLSDHGGSKAFRGYDKIYFESREKEWLRIINEGRFDFIIPIDTPQIYPILKKSLFEGVLVTEVHTTHMGFLKYLSEIGETNTRAIITPSRFEKEFVFREIRGFEKTGIPVYVVPNSIDLGLFRYQEPKSKLDKKVIGWVGRLEKGKNWKHFLEIACELIRDRDDLLFLVLGGRFAEADIKKDFLQTMKKLDLIGRLKWVPFLDFDRMPGIYSLMGASGGCLVSTSLSESFGITAIEAMACQCPVVASRVGGFQEVITDGQNGLLFEVNRTGGALAQIETLLDNTPERNRLVENGWMTVKENYSPERVVSRYLAVLRELAQQISQDSAPETEELTPSAHKLRGRSFKEAAYELFEEGKSSPMYETYVQYALGTNNRGEALAHRLSRHLQLKGKSYLDIGTAYGGYLVAFAKQGSRPYFGIEIDEKLVELCRLNLKENHLDPHSVFRSDICDGLPDPIKERKFDIITCTDVLEHVLDISKAVEHLKNLMAGKGHLYLEFPNRNHPSNILSDPHFGLFGITLLNRTDAIEYFMHARTGHYLVGDYYPFDYHLSFFPQEYFLVTKILPEKIDFNAFDNLFRTELEMAYQSKINNLSIPISVKDKLKGELENYIGRYNKQLIQRNIEDFYIQSWQILIQKK